MLLILKITNQHNSVKKPVVDLWFLISKHSLIMVYICTKFHENISQGFSIEQTKFPYKSSRRDIVP